MFTIYPALLRYPKFYYGLFAWALPANRIWKPINDSWYGSLHENKPFSNPTIFPVFLHLIFFFCFPLQIGVLITGVQNDIKHVRTVHVCTSYFSKANPTLNIDNLLPYGELELSAITLSPHLIGKDRNLLNLQVIIVPMGVYTCYDTIPFEFKWKWRDVILGRIKLLPFHRKIYIYIGCPYE